MNNFKEKIGIKKNLDKLLFLSATIYLMIVISWYWKQQSQTKIAQSSPSNQENIEKKNDLNSATPSENSPPLNLQNNQFSPDVNITKPVSIEPLNVVDNSLKIPPLSTNTPTTSSETNVLPIPQPPNPILPPPPPLPNVNAVNPPSPPSSNASPLPPPPPPKLTKVPTLSTLSSNQTNGNPNNSSQKIASLPKPNENEGKYNYTLMGVVELGESNGMALFNVNNITEKVSIGHEIGTTGWVLVGINNRQVIISRQNESVNLRVGETF